VLVGKLATITEPVSGKIRIEPESSSKLKYSAIVLYYTSEIGAVSNHMQVS
jgi:hypothetical protein